MNKQELLNKYSQEDKIMLSKMLDKIKFVKEKNKIISTDFMNLYEQKISEEVLNKLKENNYIFFGGFKEAERKVIIGYPEKISKLFENKIPNIDEYIKVIRIELPNDMKGKYVHKNYLSGLMKLGVKREKIGDIVWDEKGADIIVKSDISNYLLQELQSLKRFSKSKIIEINLNELRELNLQKEIIKVTVTSLRLDSIVSEIMNISRNKSTDIILSERVFLNFICETKNSKEVKINDTVTIRGKGRFVIKDIVGTSKKGKQIILIERFK